MDFSTICRIINMAFVVDLFFQKPCCSSHIDISSIMNEPIIRVKSFMTTLSSVIPL